jgi:hypothetical protein
MPEAYQNLAARDENRRGKSGFDCAPTVPLFVPPTPGFGFFLFCFFVFDFGAKMREAPAVQ